MFFSRKKSKIRAVHESDFQGYLKSVGIWDDVVGNRLKCQFCGTTITLENLEMISPVEGKLTFVCFNPKCINKS